MKSKAYILVSGKVLKLLLIKKQPERKYDPPPRPPSDDFWGA